jgi:hypothetical protein
VRDWSWWVSSRWLDGVRSGRPAQPAELIGGSRLKTLRLAIIDAELRQIREHRLAKTANRSVVGIMNEFTYLAMRLATTPCGPLYGKHVSPDRELGALLHSIAPPAS